MPRATGVVGQDEIATLRLIATDGGLEGAVKVSCSGLSDRLDVSDQTVSRRLQRLDDATLVTRELAPDGQWVEVTESGEHTLRREYEAYRRIFEGDRSVELVGSVTTGMGEGRHYITLEGYQVQFVERLGYEPFPGTLNVTLSDESVRRRARLEALDPIPIDGWEGEDRTYGPAVCYPATVRNRDGTRYADAHAIVPERTHHDDDQIELIAPDRLRDVLGLEDDERIEIAVAGTGTEENAR